MNHTIPSRRTGVHAALLASGLLAAAAAQAQADLILTNGKIATMVREGEFVQALAVKDGKVLATGSNAAVLKYKTATTRVIDTGGRTVIPGLNDSHTHVIREGLNYNMELRWDGVTSLKRALEMLREQAARTPEGEWVRCTRPVGRFDCRRGRVSAQEYRYRFFDPRDPPRRRR
ncbi:amidohydrolase family protein [Oxalobacteraceae sp. CFBP 8755]|nr:amidohydrolase family protein [Oxalobacteraceae sp. CFBP 8755]